MVHGDRGANNMGRLKLVAGKSYGKTERMKTKSMVSVLYSKQPSWEMTAEYLNYSLPTKEKDRKLSRA